MVIGGIMKMSPNIVKCLIGCECALGGDHETSVNPEFGEEQDVGIVSKHSSFSSQDTYFYKGDSGGA